MMEEIFKKIIEELKKYDFVISTYHSYTTSSIYIKLDYGVANGIRIADHKGKKKYKYRYNVMKDIEADYKEKDCGYERLYYRPVHIKKMVKKIVEDKKTKKQKYGEANYQKYMDIEKYSKVNQRFKEVKRVSKTLLIMGESGSGKTTSMRNLNPQETYYIDADKKGLSWKGWREQYNSEKKNYACTSNALKIKEALIGISNSRPDIKVIIIDTLNGIMVDDEFNRMKEKGFDKWQDMAYSIYDIVSVANTLREDLTVVFTMHSQTERDDTGFYFTRAKTSGKKLDKVVIESKFTTVLLAKCIDGKYVFETHSNNSTVKTPMGAFEEETIENDIVQVLDKLKDY